MTASVVQSASSNQATSPVTVTLGATPTVGNTLVALFSSDTYHTGAPTAGSGRSYTERVRTDGNGGWCVWTRLVVSGDSASTTFVPNGAFPNTLMVLEIQGTYDKIGTPLHQGANALNIAPTGLTPATTDGITLAVAGIHGITSGAMTSGSVDNGFTMARTQFPATAGSTLCGLLAAYKVTSTVAATGTTTLSWTTGQGFDRDAIQIAFTGIGSPPPSTGQAVTATATAAAGVPTVTGTRVWTSYRTLINTALTAKDLTWMVIGDSISEGTAASVVGNRWVDKANTTLKTTYQPVGVTGAVTGYLPGYYAGTAGWTPYSGRTGTVSEFAASSLGERSVRMTSAGSQTYTVTGTSADLYAAAGGVYSWKVDGGSATNVTPGTNSVTNISLGSAGSHSVTITWVSGTVTFGGVMVYNGDEASGIRVVDASHFSWKTSDFDSSLDSLYNVVSPDLIILSTGVNDEVTASAQKTLIVNKIADIRAACLTKEPAIMVGIMYQPYGRTDWAACAAALASIATDDPTVGLIDWYTAMGTVPDVSGTGYWNGDGLHPNDSGHTYMAGIAATAIAPPAGGTVTAVRATATATGRAPTVSASGNATVTAVVATATGTGQAPAVTVTATVTGGGPAAATATAGTPSVSGSGGTPGSVSGVRATAAAAAGVPVVTGTSGSVTVTAFVATATALARPAIGNGANLTAITTGTVKGWIATGVNVAPDVDGYPDLVAAVGSVTFTPVAKVIVVPGASPAPLVLIPKTVTATIDSSGYLVGTKSGERLVRLIVGKWTVTYNLGASIQLPSHIIDVAANVLYDLAELIPT